ncbi:MAG: glutaredoxin family protein [Propionicimonas sp.]|uniref:glutaredoxin family protein n=1 Tax=Propionicimonas sp. TaxID=1955623 RepID=UPI003D120BCD
MTDARVVLLVRDGCHLCEEAVAVVRAVCTETGDTWAVQDVDADPALHAEYSDHVPVTFVDGVRHAIWFVDGTALRRALSAGSAG